MGLTVGLTGGIASGKSTVARLLADRGCVVFDADRIVADLYRPGEEGHTALVAHYGDRILDSKGEIDRPALSRIALATNDSASILNGLIHPLVIERQQQLIAKAFREDHHAIVVVEATLLLESGGRSRFDLVVVVEVAPALQIARAVGRGLSRTEAAKRIARQMRSEERRAQADFVVRNDRDLVDLETEVDRLVDFLKAAEMQKRLSS